MRCLLAVGVALLVACGGGGGGDGSKSATGGGGGGDDVAAQVAQNATTLREAASHLRQTSTSGSPAARMGDTLTWIRGQPRVTSARLSPDALTLTAQFDNGLEGDLALDLAEPDSEVPLREEWNQSIYALRPPCPPNATCSDVAPKVALIKGRDLTEGLSTRHFPAMASLLRGMEFAPDTVEEAGYNTSFLGSNLGQYQVVYVYGHGGSDATTSWLATGKNPPTNAADAADVKEGRLVAQTVGGVKTAFLETVTLTFYDPPVELYKAKPEFFTHHYGPGTLARNGLVFVDGCNLRPNMGQAFYDAGISAFVFYGPNAKGETTSTTPISAKGDQEFFRLLGEGKSVGEALDQMKAGASELTLQVHPPEGRDLRFVPLANVDFTFSPCPPVQGAEVTFTQTGATPANALINKWVWDFGDGTEPQESPFVKMKNTNSIKHTFSTNLVGDDSNPGFFQPKTVKLTVTDLLGHSITIQKPVAVAERGRNLRFTPLADGCAAPPPPTTGDIRVKVIMAFGEDPNDLLADRLFNVHVLVGSTDAVIGGEDNIARIVVSGGRHVVKFPKDNGLDDPDGNPAFRVGSVNIGATRDGVSTRCAPNSQEGDVGWTFDPAVANPSSQSEYEVALRIVPFDAPALVGGASCP